MRVFRESFAFWSAVVSCHARDGVNWVRPMDGSRSFEAHAQEPCSGQGLLRSIVANVRTFHRDLPGRRQAPRNPQSTMSLLCKKPVDLRRQQQWTLLRKCRGCSLPLQRWATGATRRTSEGSTQSRAGQIQGAASGGQGGVMQDVHRTCPASRHTCRRGDQEGSGTTSGVRGGGRGGPAKVVVTAGGGGASTPSRGAGGGGIAETDRRIGQGSDLLRQGFRKGVPKDGQGEWFVDNIPDLTAVPPMPADRQDLEGWISDRNYEMRNALFGDASSIAKIGTLLSQGAALLASLSRDERMDGKSRSSLMSSMIGEADAKRRCVAASSAIVLPSRVGNQA